MSEPVLLLALGIEIGLAAGYALGRWHRWIHESRLVLWGIFGRGEKGT